MDEYYERRVMANNLENCIRKAGKAKKEVAAAKGVTPETLSRHMHGRIQMTMLDAEEYARILGCTVQEILFEQEPIPVIGLTTIRKKTFFRELHDTPRYEVYAKDQYLQDRACFLYNCDKKYKGDWYEWDGAIQFVQHSPIVDKIVSPNCFQKICIVKTSEPIHCHSPNCTEMHSLFAGILYPQPGGVYTIHNGKTNDTFKDLELEWATPILSTVFRPDLLGIHIKTLD